MWSTKLKNDGTDLVPTFGLRITSGSAVGNLAERVALPRVNSLR